VLLILGRRDGRPIAGALNLIGADALYGAIGAAPKRCRSAISSFAIYQAIDAAIARGLQRRSRRAAGRHKSRVG